MGAAGIGVMDGADVEVDGCGAWVGTLGGDGEVVAFLHGSLGLDRSVMALSWLSNQAKMFANDAESMLCI